MTIWLHDVMTYRGSRVEATPVTLICRDGCWATIELDGQRRAVPSWQVHERPENPKKGDRYAHGCNLERV